MSRRDNDAISFCIPREKSICHLVRENYILATAHNFMTDVLLDIRVVESECPVPLEFPIFVCLNTVHDLVFLSKLF